MSKTYTIERKSTNTKHFICNIITTEALTKREWSILEVILKNKFDKALEDERKSIRETLDISRDHLNGNLLRMRLKGVFDEEWNVAKQIKDIPDDVGKIVVNLN